VGCHSVDQTHFVSVLKVRADAFEQPARLDAVAFELVLWSDTAQHQKLRCIEGTGRQDYFAPGECLPRLACCCARRLEGAVESTSLQVFDANRAVAIEQEVSRVRIEFYRQRETLRGIQQPFTRPGAATIMRRQRHIENSLVCTTYPPPVVRIPMVLDEVANR